jgi:hypothetical protein
VKDRRLGVFRSSPQQRLNFDLVLAEVVRPVGVPKTSASEVLIFEEVVRGGV